MALADVSVPALESVAREIKSFAGDNNVIVVPTDVSVLAQVQALKDRVLDTWGEVGWIASRLHNNSSPLSHFILSSDLPHAICHRSQSF